MSVSKKFEINVEEYYLRYGPMVFRRCLKLLQDEEKAVDAMQEVFVRLLIHRNRLQGTYPSSLLFRIATNICLNKIREQRHIKSLENTNILSKIAYYDDREDRFLYSNLLNLIFKKERKSTRRIAVMYFIDRMTLKEVAEEAGLSISGVRKRLRILKKRVRQTWELYHGEQKNF